MEFRARCSKVIDILAEPKNKKDLVSVGSQTYCKKWLKNTLFKRYDIINTKYTQKGLDTEEDALNVLVRVLKLGMVYKNTERKTNDWITGECDFIYQDVIYDNKSSYSLDTFPMFDDKLEPKYYAQMQGYMDLWGLKKAKVCYTLVDTPIDILRKELRWLDSDNEKQQKAINHVFTEKYWQEVKKELFPNAENITFVSIEDKKRVKVFEVDRNDDFINNIHIKVDNCKEYIKQINK